MKLGLLRDLRIALGGLRPDGEPAIGVTYASAVKSAAGFKGQRLFDVFDLDEFIDNLKEYKH